MLKEFSIIVVVVNLVHFYKHSKHNIKSNVFLKHLKSTAYACAWIQVCACMSVCLHMCRRDGKRDVKGREILIKNVHKSTKLSKKID